LDTPKKQALQVVAQLPDDSSWEDITVKLNAARHTQFGSGDIVDWDGFMRRVKTILNDEFPEADALKFELEKDGRRISGYVVSKDFNGMEDADRQDRLWDILESNLSVEEQSRILSVLAYTPSEYRVAA
jgi:acid stress-induced BolA-like protein IbaG/YrbA